MVFKVGSILSAVAVMGTSDIPTLEVSDTRVLPDIRRHFREAGESFRAGRWAESLAYTDSMLVNEVRYKIIFDGSSPEESPSSLQALNDAIALWSDACEQQVTFIEDNFQPNVTIRFSREVRNQGREVGGHIQWRRGIVRNDLGELVPHGEFDIWIRTHQPGGRAMKREHLRHIISHEMGHVLGMSDSPRQGDIMGPLNLRRPAQKLQQEELESFRNLRQRALDLRRASLLTAIYELEGYNLQRASR